jgi:uncharacterized protein YndB with AHSA1/START domain
MSTESSVAIAPSLTIKRRLNAPPAKVFNAWTDPEKLRRWFLPPNTEPVLTESDARVGGQYRIVVRSAGGEEHDVSGTFREVVPDEKLVFTWAWRSTPERQSLVTVALKSEGDGTLLTLTHERFFDEAARDRHQAGWSPILDHLAQMLPNL